MPGLPSASGVDAGSACVSSYSHLPSRTTTTFSSSFSKRRCRNTTSIRSQLVSITAWTYRLSSSHSSHVPKWWSWNRNRFAPLRVA